MAVWEKEWRMDAGGSPAAEFEPGESQGEGDREDGEDDVGFVHGGKRKAEGKLLITKH
ncbi:hypothetical protein [Luteolibacter sp. Populi]|uniref:hypothetical protein n=1 Tax=Luteolibacter sp. Populi TaxID=3230487 RepID=UPI0034668D05